MIELTPDQNLALTRVVAAGRQGLPVERVGLSLAIGLGVHALATLTQGPNQHVIATPKGAAFQRRVAS